MNPRGIQPYTFYLGKEEEGGGSPHLIDVKDTQCGATLLRQPCPDALATIGSGWKEILPVCLAQQQGRFMRKPLKTKGHLNDTLKTMNSMNQFELTY